MNATNIIRILWIDDDKDMKITITDMASNRSN